MSEDLTRFLDRRIAGVTIPRTPLTVAVFSFISSNLTTDMAYHVIRSALFGLILRPRVPQLSGVDEEMLIAATLLHDMGWSQDTSLISADKRFEVDGANIAVDFLSKYAPAWSQDKKQEIWDSIALHTSASLAVYGRPIVAATCLGIGSDFAGPFLAPGGLVSEEEFREISREVPRQEFEAGVKETLCGLCVRKPETTYDNVVGEFGDKYVEGYSSEGKKPIDFIEQSLAETRKFM